MKISFQFSSVRDNLWLILFLGMFCFSDQAFAGEIPHKSESDVGLEIIHAESGAVNSVRLNGKVVFDASKHRRLTLFERYPGLTHKKVFLYGQKVYSQTWDQNGKPVGAPYIVLSPEDTLTNGETLSPVNAQPVASSPDAVLSLNAKDARERALSYVGVPYKDGGYSRAGFKTAGLIWHYFKSYGIDVPRLLQDQATAGEFVLKKDLRPGDVVVFKSGGKPNVLGIYLGNHEMIYMSYSKKVARTIKIDTPYWETRYGGGRRFFGVKLAKIEMSPEHAPVYPEDRPAPRQTSSGAGVTLPRGKEYQQGMASFYGGGDGFNGSPTANGEVFDDSKMTAAHKTLPFNTMVKVVRTDTGKSCVVRINDRGPFVRGRIIDLSYAAAKRLGMVSSGVTKVKLYIQK